MNIEDAENGPPSAKRRRKTTSPTRPTSSGSAAGNHTVALPYASFLSPTKASLARFNPGLLPSPRRRSRASKSLSPERPQDSQDRLSYVLGNKMSVAGARGEEEGDITPGKSSRNVMSEAITPTNIQNSGLTKSDDVFAPSSQRQGSAKRMPENEENEEDDLPETPEKMLQQAKNLTPRGILYHSTPRRRKQREAERQKQTVAEVQDAEERSEPAEIIKEPEKPAPVDSGLSKDVPTKEPANGFHVMLKDSEAFDEKDLDELKKKREELDALQKQIVELRSDMRDMRRQLKKMDVHVSDRPYSDTKDLVSLITRINPDADSEKRAQPPTSSLLASFLPFSTPILKPDAESDDNNPLPSHTPLPDTPQLINLFNPLTVSSQLSPPTTMEDSSISQVHTVSFSSPGKYLEATLNMTISSSPGSHTTIESLSITNLSHWAAPELSTWLNDKASENDVPSVGYALGRYWDVCIRRAKCWTRAKKAFPHLLTSSSEIALHTKKRKRDGPESEEFVLEDIIGDIGKQVLKFQNSQVALRILWTVELDWSGDVVSKVDARAAFPGSWYDADDRQSLKTIPTVFDQLVSKHGVFTAIKVMIGLLFGDPSREN